MHTKEILHNKIYVTADITEARQFLEIVACKYLRGDKIYVFTVFLNDGLNEKVSISVYSKFCDNDHLSIVLRLLKAMF